VNNPGDTGNPLVGVVGYNWTDADGENGTNDNRTRLTLFY